MWEKSRRSASRVALVNGAGVVVNPARREERRADGSSGYNRNDGAGWPRRLAVEP